MEIKTIQSVSEMIAIGAYLYETNSNVNKVDDWKTFCNENNKQEADGMVKGYFFKNKNGEDCFTADKSLVEGDATEYVYKLPVMHNLHLKNAIAKKVNSDKEFLATIKLSREELFGITRLSDEQIERFPNGSLPEGIVSIKPVFTTNVDNGAAGRSTSKKATAGAKSNDALYNSVMEAEEKKKKRKVDESIKTASMSVKELEEYKLGRIHQDTYRDSDLITTYDASKLTTKADDFKWVDSVEVRWVDKREQSWMYVDNPKNPSGEGNAGRDTRIPVGIGGVDKNARKLTIILGQEVEDEKATEIARNLIKSSRVRDVSIHTKKLESHLDENWCFYATANYKVYGLEYK